MCSEFPYEFIIQGFGMDIFDFSDIEKVIDSSGYTVNFTDTVNRLASGDSQGFFGQLFNSFINELMGELIFNKEVVIRIILMAISLALINNLSMVFKNGQIAQTGFFAIYCMVIILVVSGFLVISDVVAETIKMLINFMIALIPSLMLAFGFIGAYTSQAGYCQLLLIMMAVVENIIVKFILPVINIYVVLMLVNSLVNEDYVSKFAGLIESFVKWFTKTMLAVFTGLNIVQGMLSPSIDATKTKGFQKLADLLKTGQMVNDVIYGTGNVIKNAIGTAAVVILAVIILVPLVKVLAYIAMYKFTAAIIQPVSDKRLITAVDSVAKGASMLYRILIFCGVLFALTIAIMCIVTNNMR